ncbi:MAG: glycosyltransferase [Candidatus Liptonbacteria bacterium]|nr:glycosyltransferase [Candidatus Liptonbacteria bacterium]
MENGKPLVSVITPAYNAVVYLGDTIRSVLAQTYQNFEHIIIDDGSTDETETAVRAFSDHRVKYIRQKNSGQSTARNAGIAAAKGKYIALLDADDFFLPDKLSLQVGYLEAHPVCDFCYCKVYHFFHNDPGKTYYFKMEHPSGHLFEKLLVSNFINPLGVVVRKDVFEKYGGFGPEYRWADEQYLWLKFAYRKVNFCYMNKALGYCRLHPESFTNRPQYLQKSQEDYLRILQLVKTWMNEAEIRKYKIRRLERSRKMRIVLGKLMTGDNVFAKFLHALYLLNRRRRLVACADRARG